MQHALLMKSMLAGVAILGAGGVAGVSLANFASDGSFDLYRHAPAASHSSEMLAEADSPGLTEVGGVRFPDPEILSRHPQP